MTNNEKVYKENNGDMKTIDKPIFVVSDLHLGDKGPRDNFHAPIIRDDKCFDREKQFYLFLEHVEKSNGELSIVYHRLESAELSLF